MVVLPYAVGTLADSSISSSSSSLKIAIVGALALVLAASIPAFISARGSRRLSDSNVLTGGLVRDLQKRFDHCDTERDRLERLLWSYRINPETGLRIEDPP